MKKIMLRSFALFMATCLLFGYNFAYAESSDEEPEQTVTVHIEPNGGTMTKQDFSGYEKDKNYTFYPASFGLTAPQCRAFDGWSVYGTYYEAGEKIELEGDTILRAVWKDAHTPLPPVEEENQEPQCERDGGYFSKTYCSVCGDCIEWKYVTIEKLGHDTVFHNPTEPSCHNSGNEPYYSCSRCEKVFSDLDAECEINMSDVIHPMLKHDEVYVEEKLPTCGSYGHTCGIYCSRCGDVLVESVDIPPTEEHRWNNGTVILSATTTQAGIMSYTCQVCYTSYQVPIPKLEKKANPLKVKLKVKSVNFKYSVIKNKTKSVQKKNYLSVSNAMGKITYAKVSGNKKITVNKTNGMITVKKGLKKGTYKLKMKVTAGGTINYKSGSKTVTVTIKVK